VRFCSLKAMSTLIVIRNVHTQVDGVSGECSIRVFEVTALLEYLDLEHLSNADLDNLSLMKILCAICIQFAITYIQCH